MSNLDDFLDLNVSTSDFSKIVNISERAVRQWLTQGIIPFRNKKPYRINVKEGIHAYLGYVKEHNSVDDEKARSEKLRADADLSIAKARQEEIKLKELEGVMHHSEDVKAMTEDLIYTIRSSITSLPNKIAMDVASEDNPNKCTEIIRREVYSILEGLSEYEYSRERYKAHMKERLGALEAQKDEEEDE
ncbi:MAG: hypothetical protein K2H85_10925 [Allobaculum sp.]|nr:hypothetical protein [Allobaculum sp.]